MKNGLSLLAFLFLFPFCSFSQEEEDDMWDNYLYYLADTLGQTLRNNDTTLVNYFFDFDLFLDNFLVKKEDENIQNFNQRYKKQIRKELNIGKILTNVIQNNYYDYVNHYTSIDGEVHMLFRLLGSDGGFNYHDFHLTWVDSTFRITDIFYYANGERISESLGMIYKDLLRSSLNVKTGVSRKNEAANAINQLLKVKEYMAALQYKTAMAEYMKIPEKYREQRIYKYWRIKISEELTDEEYLEAVDAYTKSYPDDPSFYFLAFDRALVKEDWDDALKYLEKLDNSLGLDPFLDYFRGMIYFQKKEYALAEEKLFKAKENYRYEKIYDFLLEIYIETKQYTKVLTLLNGYIEELDYSKKEISGWLKDAYPEFVKQPEFLHWEKIE